MNKLSLAVITTALFTLIDAQAYALNPQPEVPSKSAPNVHSNPYALNPQPEVPSKPRIKNEWAVLKALSSRPGTTPKKTKATKSKHMHEKHAREMK